jgi:predicted amidohydrolase
MIRILGPLLVVAALLPAEMPGRLRVAVVQMTLGPTLESNRDRIVAWIPRAAARGARVVVFPEGALSIRSDAPEGDVEGAVRAIRHAARGNRVYVLFGGWTWSARVKKAANWMKVIGPDGAELLHYDKLWDIHDAATPAIFHLDGIPASAIICADRWLRGLEDLPVQQGARISFELSNNFASEWAPELEWYWYVPRALRNTVFVVFANTANRTPGKPEPGVEQRPRHGHSAVVAPDGSLVAAARDDLETLLIADLDIAQATRAEALARSGHARLGRFWQTGLDLLNGRPVAPARFAAKESADAELRVAAAQVSDGAAAMVEVIREAGRRQLDLVAFPLLAASVPVDRIREAAREAAVTVAFALPRREDGRLYNTAYVIGPDGAVLTRHDQVSAAPPLTAGARLSTMWFRVKGVPAVVSVSRDALWNEIAELAAVAGARLHVNLAREPAAGRRQIGAALASFTTLTVMANAPGPDAGRSAIWDDLSAREESRAEVRDLPRPDPGPVKVFSAFSANLVAEAGEDVGMITATRRVRGPNPHYPQRTAQYHPAMNAFYVAGARLITGAEE